MAQELSAPRLEELARTAGQTVRAYIAAQNTLLRFSFPKALGFVKPQPALARGRTAQLREQTLPLLEELRAFRLESPFAITLRGYLRHLIKAMIFFEEFCDRYDQAIKTKDKAYLRRGGLKADLEQLQQSEREYLTIGLKLNSMRSGDGEKSPGENGPND